MFYDLCSMPFPLCPMPSKQPRSGCSPYALSPMPFPLCSLMYAGTHFMGVDVCSAGLHGQRP